jgi:hypothetical protein
MGDQNKRLFRGKTPGRELLHELRRPASNDSHSWHPLGMGGGGAMFTPAISPADPRRIRLSCDMSGVYRSADGGKSREMIHYRQLSDSTKVRPHWHPIDLMRVPPWRRDSAVRQGDAMFPWVVASAPGFGPGWAAAVREPGASGDVAIRLVTDGPPIEGRIVDLEGRPVAGARVKAESVWLAMDGKLSDWLAKAADGGVQGPWEGLHQLPTALTATSGADGRFRMAGIGRDRIAELIVSGPTIATAIVYALNRDGAAIGTTNTNAMTPERTIYHARRFEYAIAPTKTIEGVIRDKDTGQAIAGLMLRSMVFDEHSFVPARGIEATTDAQGHYRLNGLPKGPAYRLFLEPGDGLPYTKATFRVPANTPALEPVNFDVKLKRGVVVQGRVTDKATGKPVSGHVESYAFSDNTQITEFPGYRSSYTPHAPITDDGRYEVVILPGRGLIACRSDLGLYRGYVGADAIKGFDGKNGTFNTSPFICNVRNYHVLAEVNLDLNLQYRICTRIARDPNPRTRSVEATARDHQPRSAEARRFRQPQWGRDRSSDCPARDLGNNRRPHRR